MLNHWYARRLLWAFDTGLMVLAAAECLVQAMKARKPVTIPDPTDAERAEWKAKREAYANDMVRDLDRAAGAPHFFVGDDKSSCALCVVPSDHPIHFRLVDGHESVDAEIVPDDET
jgi:hypothetical protein